MSIIAEINKEKEVVKYIGDTTFGIFTCSVKDGFNYENDTVCVILTPYSAVYIDNEGVSSYSTREYFDKTRVITGLYKDNLTIKNN